MRRSWAAVTVGLLLLVVGGASYFIVKLTSEHSSGARGITVWARFHDASGLYSKSRVQTAGIPVGQIEDRTLDPDQPLARITIRMSPSIKLYENASVAKKAASLLGEYYLEIDPGAPVGIVAGQRRSMALLKSGDEIKDVREPTAMGDLMNDVGTIMPILRDILTDVRRLTAGPVSDIAENVNRMIETNSVVLERLLERVDHIAGNVEHITDTESDDVRMSLRNIRDITDSVKAFVGTTQGEVTETGTNMRQSLDKVQGTLASLDRTLQNLEKVSDRVEKGEGTVGHLLSDDTIARNLDDITDDASTFVKGVTGLQTIVGLRSEYNFLSSSVKDYLSVQLMPRPDKFYLLELVDDPRGYRTTTQSYVQSTNMPPTLSTTTTYTDQLKFSFMFGKTYGILTGRFGIKESTGGIGADLHLLADRLLLSVDVFDTKYNRYPRVQTRASVSLWRNSFYLIAGLDDVLNSRTTQGGGGGFDFFMGGQLVFNDQDLKTLLLFGGSAAGAAAK